MPSTSAKQHRFMEAVAHNSAFAKKVGVPQSVGKDFSAADKGRTFSKGGADMDMKKPNPFMEMIAKKKEKAEGESPSFQKKEGKKGEKAEMKFAKGGSIMRPKKDIARDQMAMAPYARGGMAKGGMAKGGMHKMPDGKMMKNSAMNMGGMAKYVKGGGIESKGKTVGSVIKMASGGSVSSRADGIASRGKTNCKIC
jgi:hypothetical protein